MPNPYGKKKKREGGKLVGGKSQWDQLEALEGKPKKKRKKKKQKREY